LERDRRGRDGDGIALGLDGLLASWSRPPWNAPAPPSSPRAVGGLDDAAREVDVAGIETVNGVGPCLR